MVNYLAHGGVRNSRYFSFKYAS